MSAFLKTWEWSAIGKVNTQWNSFHQRNEKFTKCCPPAEVLSGGVTICSVHTHTVTVNWLLMTVPNSHWEKNHLFTKGCWENRMSTCKGMKLDPHLTLHGRINSGRTEHWSVWPKTAELLEDNVGGMWYSNGAGDDGWIWLQKLRNQQQTKTDLIVPSFWKRFSPVKKAREQ